MTAPPLYVQGTPEQLRQVGARIRKSLEHGYQVPDKTFFRVPIEKKLDKSVKPLRQPLPAGMSQPPQLVSNGSSSFSSSSSLSCWEEEINKPQTRHMVTLTEAPQFDQKPDFKNDLSQLESQYGKLAFNETF